MKTIIFSLVIFSFFRVSAQRCDTLNGRIINCIDELGRKQGLWEMYSNKIISKAHTITSYGCHLSERNDSLLIQKGIYKDDEKVGLWYYFNGNFMNDINRSVRYLDDGSREVKDYRMNFTYTQSADSSNLSGVVLHKRDSIFIECKDDICYFKLSNGKYLNQLDSVNILDLDYEISRIRLGMYHRLIKRETGN